MYDITLNFLKGERHDVLGAQELDLQRASDEELLRNAKQSGRLLLTRDTGFGALAFFRSEESSGVILLRGKPAEMDRVHQELLRLLTEYTEEDLGKFFCVVEPRRYRIRPLPEK